MSATEIHVSGCVIHNLTEWSAGVSNMEALSFKKSLRCERSTVIMQLNLPSSLSDMKRAKWSLCLLSWVELRVAGLC
jgi:hypothetical protein